MKAIHLAVCLVIGGGLVLAGYTVTRLSSDAIGLAIGLAFGVLTGIPFALFTLASQRERDGDCYTARPEPPQTIMLIMPVASGDPVPYIGDGEYVNGRYWYGNYSSDRQFRIVKAVHP